MPSTSVVTVVPASPAMILLRSPSAPIAARLPVAETNRQAASTLGPMDPAANGMAAYSGVLDAEGADAIRAFLIKEANDALPPNAPR